MTTVISVENLSKSYRLGQIGTGTFSHDLNAWWARLRGKPNPLLKIGQADHGSNQGEELWALRDVSFSVQQGEVLGIIGRNGAGKSTLLKILSRVTAPTSGKIKVRGRIASLLEVGTGFHPELTGRENIYLNGAILGMSRREIERKFDEIVDFSEVEKFIDTPVKRYSSGMYVRLAFAVAAHLEPEILVVDEVLAVGDAEFQKKCLGKMGDVAEQGRTVIFVSHNMTAVTNLCKMGLLLQGGRVVSLEKINDVVSSYLTAFSSNLSISEYICKSDEFELCRLSISQELTKNQNFVTSKPLIIEFEYIVEKKISGLRVGFDILSSDGSTIFRSFDNDILHIPVRQPGRYISRCQIPSNFFSPNDYFFAPKIGIHHVKWLSDSEHRIRLSFIQIDGVNADFTDKRPGLIMPGLDWSVKR